MVVSCAVTGATRGASQSENERDQREISKHDVKSFCFSNDVLLIRILVALTKL